MDKEEKSVYQQIRKECLTVPFDLDLRNLPYQDDELEFKLIKKTYFNILFLL